MGGPYQLADEARQLLVKAEWKDGNIRALRNAIRAMTEHHVDRMLSPKAIPAWVWKQIDLGGSPGSNVPSVSSSGALTIPLVPGPLPQFDSLSDLLLVEAIRHIRENEDRHSLRTIGEALGIPKTTLSSKLNRLRERGLMPDRELDSIIGGKNK